MTGAERLARWRANEELLNTFVRERMENVTDNAKYLGVYDAEYATLALADAAAVSSGKWLVITKTWNVVPATIAADVFCTPNGKINNASAVTFTGTVRLVGFYEDCFIGSGTVHGVTPKHEKKPIVMLVAGQSGAKGFYAANGGNYEMDDGIFLWDTDATNNPLTFGTKFNKATLGVAPLNIMNGAEYAQLLGYQTAREIRKRTGSPVYVIQLANGSHAIEAFLPPSTLTAQGWTKPEANEDLSAYLFTGNPSPVKAALAQVPGSPTTIDLVIFHGGEANSADSARSFAYKGWWLVNWLGASGLIDPDRTPIVFGELAQVTENGLWYASHKAGLHRLALDYPNVRVASSDGIQIIGDTNLHFDGEGVVQLGKRYAEMAFSEPLVDDFADRAPRLDVDSCLRDFTTSGSGLYQDRPPVAIGSALISAVNHPVLGWCWKVPANTAVLYYTRRLFLVPVDSAVKITYEILVEAVGATVDHRAVVYQFDKNKVAIGTLVSPPSTTPLTPAMGRTIVSQAFSKALGVFSDSSLDPACEFVAIGFNFGVGGDDEELFFNILDIDPNANKNVTIPVAKTANYAITPGEIKNSFSNLGATGIITFTLPHASVGMKTGTFIRLANYEMRIDPWLTTNKIGGGALGKYLILSSVDEAFSLECFSDGVWSIVGASPGATPTYEP